MSVNHASGSNVKLIGTPTFIQSTKEIETLYCSSIKPFKVIFGAVPINVAIPPIFAAYAIPNRRATWKFTFSESLKFFPDSFTTEIIARPIGSSMTVVEVFMIHILKRHELTMKPAMMDLPAVPVRSSTLSAILL